MSLKAGVIGVGHLGRFHAQKYILNQKTNLIGVYDTDFNRAQSVGTELNTKVFKSVDELLNEINIVSVASPATKHFESTLKAINKGVHVLVEKPFTHSIEEAEKLVAVAKENKVYLQVGFIERFNIVFNQALKYIEEPIFIQSQRLAPFTGRSIDIDVVKDLMIHDVDLMLMLLGNDITSIEAAGNVLITDKIDIAQASIEFKNKCVVNLTASRVSDVSERKMTVFQKDNFLKIDFQNASLDIFKKSNEVIVPEKHTFNKNDSLFEQLDYFIDVVSKKIDSKINIYDAVSSIKITDIISKKIYDRLNLL